MLALSRDGVVLRAVSDVPSGGERRTVSSVGSRPRGTSPAGDRGLLVSAE